MQQNEESTVSRKVPRNLFPWIAIGAIAALVVIVIIIQSFRPIVAPQPTAPMRYPRVHLTIKSNVGGAEVYLNGQQKTVTSDSRREAKLLNLGRKTHEILLKKQGYTDRREMVEITGITPSQTVKIDMHPGEVQAPTE
ncbi:MAG: PEGA domain-containing protein [Candidatus Poribacteria bacterium]|nr:PEGA domain-containing protein [Candidatus Poribacteria bacterium]MDE0504048.1 PEGA domain-containing protein [Candidatus Poribacteria bacterium]